jgi:hypothetical protein
VGWFLWWPSFLIACNMEILGIWNFIVPFSLDFLWDQISVSCKWAPTSINFCGLPFYIASRSEEAWAVFFSSVELEQLCFESQGEVCCVVTLYVFMDPHIHNKMFHDDKWAWVCHEQCQITLKLTIKLSLFQITPAVGHLWKGNSAQTENRSYGMSHDTSPFPCF